MMTIVVEHGLVTTIRKNSRKKLPKTSDTTTIKTQKKGACPKTSAAVEGGRMPNYSEDEDYLIAVAYTHVTVDPIRGVGQKGENFWMRVHEKFCMLQQNELVESGQDVQPRNKDSVEQRWKKKISKSVQLWNKFYKQLKGSNKSGWNEAKYIEEAGNLYKDENSSSILTEMSNATKDLVVAFKANASPKRDQLRMRTHDKWMKMASMYISCGKQDLALQMMQKIQDDEARFLAEQHATQISGVALGGSPRTPPAARGVQHLDASSIPNDVQVVTTQHDEELNNETTTAVVDNTEAPPSQQYD
ncbi:No apical meristem-associated C-terminal domain [Fragilaria crotonensis]|nr:No apical meristem-associated C-terminal domain [Fragilaria crotonensis]